MHDNLSGCMWSSQNQVLLMFLYIRMPPSSSIHCSSSPNTLVYGVVTKEIHCTTKFIRFVFRVGLLFRYEDSVLNIRSHAVHLHLQYSSFVDKYGQQRRWTTAMKDTHFSLSFDRTGLHFATPLLVAT